MSKYLFVFFTFPILLNCLQSSQHNSSLWLFSPKPEMRNLNVVTETLVKEDAVEKKLTIQNLAAKFRNTGSLIFGLENGRLLILKRAQRLEAVKLN